VRVSLITVLGFMNNHTILVKIEFWQFLIRYGLVFDNGSGFYEQTFCVKNDILAILNLVWVSLNNS